MTFAFAEPTEWWLELSPTVRTAVWEQQRERQFGATPDRRWNAYLNQVCLTAFLAWLQAEYAPEAIACSPVSASGWAGVNGTAIQVGTTRIVLIPTEAIDSSELEVPQEWVDIPSWVSDYYLAVQVQLQSEGEIASPAASSEASQWLRVWGYTTHQDLKTIGRYDPDDRTYCLKAPALTQDLNAFWVTLQFCPEAQTRTAIAPLPELSAIQVENLLQRLNRAEVVFPRLTVPFELWGALLEQQALRQIQQSQELANQLTRNWVNLSQWFQQRVEGGWQSLEALFGTAPDSLTFSFRSTVEAEEAEVTQGKLIELTPQPDRQTVVVLVRLRTEADQRVGITAQIHPDRGSALQSSYVPARLTLALLSEAGDTLQSVQATEQDNYIQLRRFRCVPGTRFSLQVTLDDRSVTEDFIA
jgi:Protein of unknown function (DUF1822)